MMIPWTNSSRWFFQDVKTSFAQKSVLFYCFDIFLKDQRKNTVNVIVRWYHNVIRLIIINILLCWDEMHFRLLQLRQQLVLFYTYLAVLISDHMLSDPHNVLLYMFGKTEAERQVLYRSIVPATFHFPLITFWRFSKIYNAHSPCSWATRFLCVYEIEIRLGTRKFFFWFTNYRAIITVEINP